MSSDRSTSGVHASGDFHSPGYSYIHALVKDHNNRKTQCILLVAIAAIVMWSFGLVFTQIVLTLLEVGQAGLTDQLFSGNSTNHPGSVIFHPLAGLTLIAHLMAYAFPLVTVLVALLVYDRTYKKVRHDLIFTPMSLMLFDDQFAASIEYAKSLRYRPRLIPVTPGSSIVQKIRHFALYYQVYYGMCYRPAEIQVPYVVGTNCWFDGGALWIANSFCCLPVSIWFMIRLMVLWPRITAIQKCVLDFLLGKFDQALEHPNQSAN